MHKYILIGAFLLSGSALAQEQKSYTLTVTAGEVAVIAQALGDRPFKEVHPIFKKLDEQLKEQNTPKPKPEEPKPQETPEK